ncbi:PilZ domain-containing protein [Sphingomonas sp.]|uniref:PilZ domain-containing protein n=1 Tax=Sphingomonas sp. TaxID=28214 RepID=UPI00286DBDAD|nr:PilZ domain-containing protein [Sphingomonas sp.]
MACEGYLRNSFRSSVLSGQPPARPVLVVEKAVTAAEPEIGPDGEIVPRPEAGLTGIRVTRSEARRGNQRGADRHRLTDEQASVRHGGETYLVELVNLSGGGAMIRGDFTPLLWDRVDLILAAGTELECAVRWLRDDRIGLEFAHETRIDCHDDERDELLLAVVRRSFPDLVVAERPAPDEAESSVNARRERRHPLIWMGQVHYEHDSAKVRLRNISEHGALIESPTAYPEGAEVLLDLGEAGQHFATVGWTGGGKAGLAFAAPFDLQSLRHARPEIAPARPMITGAPRYTADDENPWAEGWQRLSVEELRDDLEGYLKR